MSCHTLSAFSGTPSCRCRHRLTGQSVSNRVTPGVPAAVSSSERQVRGIIGDRTKKYIHVQVHFQGWHQKELGIVSASIVLVGSVSIPVFEATSKHDADNINDSGTRK